MAAAEQEVTHVNITIASLNGMYATKGVFLEDGRDQRCPKLYPGEVVAVPTTHPILRSDRITITQEPVTRPYRFDTERDAYVYVFGEEAAGEHEAMVTRSQELLAEERAINKNVIEGLSEKGVTGKISNADIRDALKADAEEGAEEDDTPQRPSRRRRAASKK